MMCNPDLPYGVSINQPVFKCLYVHVGCALFGKMIVSLVIIDGCFTKNCPSPNKKTLKITGGAIFCRELVVPITAKIPTKPSRMIVDCITQFAMK